MALWHTGQPDLPEPPSSRGITDPQEWLKAIRQYEHDLSKSLRKIFLDIYHDLATGASRFQIFSGLPPASSLDDGQMAITVSGGNYYFYTRHNDTVVHETGDSVFKYIKNSNAATVVNPTTLKFYNGFKVYENTGGIASVTYSTVPISKGGTGKTTQAAAFSALSPMTTQGDMLVYSGGVQRRGIGSDGEYLVVSGNTPAWKSVSVGNYESELMIHSANANWVNLMPMLPDAGGNQYMVDEGAVDKSTGTTDANMRYELPIPTKLDTRYIYIKGIKIGIYQIDNGGGDASFDGYMIGGVDYDGVAALRTNLTWGITAQTEVTSNFATVLTAGKYSQTRVTLTYDVGSNAGDKVIVAFVKAKCFYE